MRADESGAASDQIAHSDLAGLVAFYHTNVQGSRGETPTGSGATEVAMNRRPWLVPLLAGAAVRLLYLLCFPQREPHADDHFYWLMAQSLATGHGYVINGEP